MSQSYLYYSKKVSNITRTPNDLNNTKPSAKPRRKFDKKLVQNKITIYNEMDEYLNEIYLKKSIELNDKYYLKDIVTRKMEIDNWNSTLSTYWYAFGINPIMIIKIN